MNIQSFADSYLGGLKAVLADFDLERYEKIVLMIMDAYHDGAHIFVMGNGGSGATASHFACDINKGCCMDLDRKFKVMCLNDNMPTLLALANDVSYDVVFEAQLKNFFVPGDLVIGISGSGNSENVLRAIRYAGREGGRTVGLSGFSGGRLSETAEVTFVAPVHDMQKVEDVHMILIHMIMQTVYGLLHGESAGPCDPMAAI
jgi:D-sedoheptulose 7-phosphate isomerase